MSIQLHEKFMSFCFSSFQSSPVHSFIIPHSSFIIHRHHHHSKSLSICHSWQALRLELRMWPQQDWNHSLTHLKSKEVCVYPEAEGDLARVLQLLRPAFFEWRCFLGRAGYRMFLMKSWGFKIPDFQSFRKTRQPGHGALLYLTAASWEISWPWCGCAGQQLRYHRWIFYTKSLNDAKFMGLRLVMSNLRC